MQTKPKKPYRPAITPRLKPVYAIVLTITALLGANSIYLVSVTLLESTTQESHQGFFYQYMFLGHLVLGLMLLVPFLYFAISHMRNTWQRKNRAAVRMGYVLFTTWIAMLGSGLLLTRLGPLEIRDEAARAVFYWTHVITPIVAIWAYCLHRLAGPPIKWRRGVGYIALLLVVSAAAIAMHKIDPRGWYQAESSEGAGYFEPSLATTSNGKFISLEALQNDAYCLECHPDTHAAWSESAHRFSSFNNPAYLASVRETRRFSMEREGSVRRARWCAGCHDPAPFFSGEFDDPNYDDIRSPSAHAGITCTACHAITSIDSPKGNADYTIEEPLHYPFAYSNNEVLKWINRQLVKAKPAFHKHTFLKPLHKSPDFCATCHKVHLPEELNDYRFLRGQNHFDSYHLSGVSGHGARSFYYPPEAHANCNRCHMPLEPSDDFGAKRFAGADVRSVHDHLFPGGNTALPHWRGALEAVEAQQEILNDCARVDLFGVRREGEVDGELIAPLRPNIPTLTPGEAYLFDTVIRTLTLGHHFTQGTADSNEIWLNVTATLNGEEIGRSGTLDLEGEVDRWAHYVNAFVLDREGNRINRRNAQDIFVALYNHQIPPGAGQTIHYRLEIPEDATGELTVCVNMQYRKFDQEYVNYVRNALSEEDVAYEQIKQQLPITTIASDSVTFRVGEAGEPAATDTTPDIPLWQRWNDYGIGMLLKGTGELRQAEQAFSEVEKLGRYDGPLNLARVYYREGRLDEAAEAVARAATYNDPAPPSWTLGWLSGLVNREQGRLDSAEENFRGVLSAPTAEMRRRGFDFRQDYIVRNLLGQTLFDQSRRERGDQAEQERLLRDAVAQFEQTLEIDPENVDAHFGLQQAYAALDEKEKAEQHRQLHLKYKIDDNAAGIAVAAARRRYPAANHAAEMVVIYDLQREADE